MDGTIILKTWAIQNELWGNFQGSVDGGAVWEFQFCTRTRKVLE